MMFRSCTRRAALTSALFFVLLIQKLSIVAINPEDDFEGYMDSLQQRKAAQRQRQEMFEKHEVCKSGQRKLDTISWSLE